MRSPEWGDSELNKVTFSHGVTFRIIPTEAAPFFMCDEGDVSSRKGAKRTLKNRPLSRSGGGCLARLTDARRDLQRVRAPVNSQCNVADGGPSGFYAFFHKRFAVGAERKRKGFQ